MARTVSLVLGAAVKAQGRASLALRAQARVRILKHLKLILEIDAHFRVLDAVHWFWHRRVLIHPHSFDASDRSLFFCLQLSREGEKHKEGIRTTHTSPVVMGAAPWLPSSIILSLLLGVQIQIE